MSVTQILEKIEKINEKLDNVKTNFYQNTLEILLGMKEISDKLNRDRIKNDKTEIDRRYEESIEEARAENVQQGKCGRLRVGKIAGMFDKGRKYPITYGYRNIIVVSQNKNKLGSELSPFVLKDENGQIMENIWQFSKIYEQITAQNQKSGWNWKAETHVKKENVKILQKELRTRAEGKMRESELDVSSFIELKYWSWRESGIKFEEPVRFPVGSADRYKCLGLVWPFDENCVAFSAKTPMKIMDYNQARKEVYIPLYIKLAQQTDDFKKLKKLLKQGYNLQILDIDGPKKIYSGMTSGIYGEDKVGSIEITPETLKMLLEDTDHPFGHGYCLAMALSNFDLKSLDSINQ